VKKDIKINISAPSLPRLLFPDYLEGGQFAEECGKSPGKGKVNFVLSQFNFFLGFKNQSTRKHLYVFFLPYNDI